MRTIAALVLLVAVNAFADDSAVVAAAKRSKETRAKTAVPVITNAKLAKKGGHVTTTKSQRSLAAVAPKKNEPAVAAPAPAPPPAQEKKNVAEKEPSDDALSIDDPLYDDFADHAGMLANIPKVIAATPEFTKPHFVASTAPPVVKPATPPAVPSTPPPVIKATTPQYTPTATAPPPSSHTPKE